MAKYYVRDSNYGTFKDYYAIGKGERSQWANSSADPIDHPYARVKIEPAKVFPNFDNAEKSGISEEYKNHAYDKFQEEHHSPDFNPESFYRTVGTTRETAPETLFTHIPATVSDAFTHSKMRHHIPLLLAMAHRDNPVLQPSDDLSIHSSPLAKRGIALGVVQPNVVNPNADVKNSITFDDQMYTMSGDTLKGNIKHVYTEVPEEEVAASKKHLRDILRPPQKERKTVLKSPQFDQQLPGMEGL